MKTRHYIIPGILSALLAVALWHTQGKSPKPSPSVLHLEEILSIKELHLVKYSYNDLFYIHRRNNSDKPVRAIAHVPVSVTSYINLKEISIEKVNDTIRRVVLPAARMQDPVYSLDKMRVTKTRSFQLHAGADQYPEVVRYLSQILVTRKDSVRALALRNNILEQAEAEGKDYIENLLVVAGYRNVEVTFGDVEKDRRIKAFQRRNQIEKKTILRTLEADTTLYNIDYVATR
jgi:hypothetical protein